MKASAAAIAYFIASLAASALPVITLQPQSQTLALGGSTRLSALATNTNAATYQWQLNGVNVPLTLSTMAGIGTDAYSGDGGPATNATLNYPFHAAPDKYGNLFIADYNNNCIRKVSTNGIITTVAGNGIYDYTGDGGAATNAMLDLPVGIAVDRSGNIYFSETDSFTIRRVDTNGIITRVAGIVGFWGYSGDGGPAINAKLDGPRGLAVDGSGNLFIADVNQNVIRKISTNGIITTVAGNGSIGHSGDGGQATNAALSLGDPGGVAADESGNLFIADVYNNCIRKISTNGIISTVAGNGEAGFYGDGGAATNASLNGPTGVAVDEAGNLFIADYYNSRIRRVATDGIISTAAGTGASSFTGETGPALESALNNPCGVATDTQGHIYIVDYNNNRIRKMNSEFLPTLNLDRISVAQRGDYTLIISDASGSVTSSVANVEVFLPITRFQVSYTGSDAQVHISGPANFTYVVQMAAELKTPMAWTSLSTNQADSNGVIEVTVPNAPFASSYFRATSP